jgi:hypothetical protein
MSYGLNFSPMFEGVDVGGGWSILYMLRAQLNLEVCVFFLKSFTGASVCFHAPVATSHPLDVDCLPSRDRGVEQPCEIH